MGEKGQAAPPTTGHAPSGSSHVGEMLAAASHTQMGDITPGAASPGSGIGAALGSAGAAGSIGSPQTGVGAAGMVAAVSTLTGGEKGQASGGSQAPARPGSAGGVELMQTSRLGGSSELNEAVKPHK